MPVKTAWLPKVSHSLASLSRNRALLNIGALFSGSTVARVLSALSIFILARQLGVDRFGQYTAALSLVKLASILFSLGLDSWLLREGRRRPDGFGAAVGANLATKVGLGLFWLIVLAIVAPFLNQTSFPTTLVLLAGLSTVLEELTATGWSAFKAALRNKVTVWLIISAPAILLLLTLLLALQGVEAAAYYFVARILAFAVAGAIALLLAWRSFGIEVRWRWMPTVLRETRAFGLSHGFSMIYERADITIIAYVLGATAAGLYAPAVTLMTTLFLIPHAIYEVMLPMISALHARSPAQVKRPAFRLFLLSAALGVVLGLGMTVIAYPLVWLLYGPEFAASAPILVILSNVLVFKAVSFALAAVLAAVGWQGKRVIIQAAVALLSIVATLLAATYYGIEGVAYVYVLTEFLLMGGYLALLLRWQRQSLPQASGSVAAS
ncbi:MAG: oligosaccharide flippase family protein [bacterium]